ncbi:hypothetical protein [Leptolyngbya sp. FACHB-711]|uniref:hypothetical protein n=1 Tax=Leptolyngbya sp. FACHB-711 TaxID=2692813 RepID=UPI0016866A3D|nr:hypothetical protein [Leptolyngbya sp. FACHB-711]MBD1849107.1 hypothetical protein [Cyanobacteria bacterium FACHB-502]MBD2028145.1 hypothetical protein [Leptolyngbya sp. FACHB-711]
MFSGKVKKRRAASTGDLDSVAADTNHRPQSSNLRRPKTTDDLTSTTLDLNFALKRRDTDRDNDTDRTATPSSAEQSSSDSQSLRASRLRSIQDDQVAIDGAEIEQAIGKTKRRSSAVLRDIQNRNLALIKREPAKPSINTTKLKNPNVRREAEKLAGRVDKFRGGILQLVALGGDRALARVNLEAELQKIIDLADANGDVQMLKDFSDATSFKGKLSPFEPTTESGRSLVRMLQLFKAVAGDGSYNTVRTNIGRLKTDASDLRQMARDTNLLQGSENAQFLDHTQYVDVSRLLRTADSTTARQIKEITREWYLEQASLMKAYRDLNGKDAAVQKKLALTMLQGFGKVAPLGPQKAEELGAQVSPVLNEQALYYRSGKLIFNPLLNTVQQAYCSAMGLDENAAHLIDNSTFREVLAREYGMEGVNTKITSQADFSKALQDLFSNAQRGGLLTNNVVLDITDLFHQEATQPKEINKMNDDLEKAFFAEVAKFLATHPDMDKKVFASIMERLQIGAMTRYKGVDVLLTPYFLIRTPRDSDTPLQKELLQAVRDNVGLRSLSGEFFDSIQHSMSHSGYLLDPIQARKAWLEVEDPSTVLKKRGLQLTELATSDKPTPKVFSSFKDFTKHKTFQQFETLANTVNAPPYLKTLPTATVNLLRGLAAYNLDKGGIDKAMQDQELDEVLQTSYYRMLNAMASAVDSQAFLKTSANRPTSTQISEAYINFLNQVEVIQQQIATLLSLVEPYSTDAFGDSIRARLTNPSDPIIPTNLDKPGVQLKPSAMHCLASILSSVEALKKSNELNVCVVKDHYYESAGAVTASGTYSVSKFDGDTVRGSDGISTVPLDPSTIQGKKPLDLYVCDFHHNISLGRNHYQIENLQHHVDELYRNNLVADKFTVAIDCTIDFVNSKDVQAFLEHNKDRIASGKLNVVLFRSAQKFDMLGMDNYYGGFTVNINSHKAFADFNQRMETPEDQLKGTSLQGLSHIGVHASQDTDEYRKAIMDNTKRFYNALTPGMVWSPGTTSVMQVAKTDDPNAVFLDIKFPGNTDAEDAFVDKLKEFATQEKLPLTGRASFGFATSNLNQIRGEKIRLTPGLEGSEIQDRYIAFFNAVYQRANDAAARGTQQGLQGDALKQFIAGEIKNMPLKSI